MNNRYITDDVLPEHVAMGFSATDNFPVHPSQVRVLVYFDTDLGMYLVDIQHMTLQGKWFEDQDPFRSNNMADCVEYYTELKNSDTYSDVTVLV